ncbi:hypothetical protein HW555_005390 [Spodoptera exigua]|uniref:Uncharacterized protein n=1 Tax=Spodoptera exigua TaxID=7107 RepID=A0A835L7G8_SPOEX|nr:hypothetical protein HW555_005390 [Spodoptera exigua]
MLVHDQRRIDWVNEKTGSKYLRGTMRHSHLKKAVCVTAVSIIVSVMALSDVNQRCIAENNGTISNDFLLGTWYFVYQFDHIGPIPTCTCPNTTFTRPTEEELSGYRAKYGSYDLPHKITEDSLVADRGYIKGLILGGLETKTYIIDPKSVMSSGPEGYEVYVYRRINEKFAFFWRCAMRGHVRYLMTNDRNATEEEKQLAIKDRSEVFNKLIRKYCVDICY